jgi:hypothetical protein
LNGFKIGDLVSVKVPKIDIGGTDLPRLPAKVSKIKVLENNTRKYKLLCDSGIIATYFNGDELKPSDIGS